MLALILALQLADGEARKVAGDMKFTEGPAVTADGTVYFTDIPNERIMAWDGKELRVWREKSGRANGLFFDGNALLVCEGGARRLTRIEDGKVTVLADSYGGKKLNSPNDLCLANGGIYFTDPRYGKRDDLEQDREAVYFLREKLVRVADDLVRPNGIIATRDRLYIADNGAKKVYVYAMNEDGTLRDKRLFCEAQCDGMTLDERGNVYTTTGKGVEVFSPGGKALETIAIPEHPSNCTFGGRTLYVTARTSLYAVPMNVGGYDEVDELIRRLSDDSVEVRAAAAKELKDRAIIHRVLAKAKGVARDEARAALRRLGRREVAELLQGHKNPDGAQTVTDEVLSKVLPHVTVDILPTEDGCRACGNYERVVVVNDLAPGGKARIVKEASEIPAIFAGVEAKDEREVARAALFVLRATQPKAHTDDLIGKSIASNDRDNWWLPEKYKVEKGVVSDVWMQFNHMWHAVELRFERGRLARMEAKSTGMG